MHATQAAVHEKWGGVVPKLAQAAHEAAIDGTVDEALRRAGPSRPPPRLFADALARLGVSQGCLPTAACAGCQRGGRLRNAQEMAAAGCSPV